jgi:dolichol-phosphate mannosyltransferase
VDLSIVVPCFNEADNVTKIRQEFFPVVAELARKHSVEIVFVDDGSSDGTWQALVDAFGADNYLPGVAIRFERHQVNRGLGAAIRTGFAAAKGEIIITTDSDGTYKFSEIPSLLACLTPEVDMVTASPYHPQGGMVGVPAYRLILSQGSSLMYRVLVNWRIHTYTALFRAYRRRIIERIPFEADGFLAGTEILVNGMLLGYRVAEYPVVLHSRVFGTSKAKLIRTIKEHLHYQAQVLLRRLSLKPIPQPRQAIGGQK